MSVQAAVPSYQAGMSVRFARARRHSRFVRVLRVAVPTIVLVSMGAIVAVSLYNPFRLIANLPVDIGSMVVSGTRITMETPHLAGYAPDGRPYELWAQTATQDITKPDFVELAALRAKVNMEDNSTVTMNARQGLFDTKKQLLDLREQILLKSSTGYEAKLSRALVDIASGSVTSDEPVDVKLLNGDLRGNGLKITERGEIVRFEGGVIMNLKMEPPTQPADATGNPTPAEPATTGATSPGVQRRANTK